MRRIPDDMRKMILKRIIAGYTYRKIQREFNVSLATINQIKEKAKETIPDIEDLKKLSILLKKSNVNFCDTFRGAHTLDKLNRCGISLDDLDKFIKLIETLFSEGTGRREEFVAAAIKLMDLGEKTGKTYRELLSDFQEMSSEIPRLKNEVNCLIEKKHQEEVRISNLEGAAERLQDYNLTLTDRKCDLLDDICTVERLSNALKKVIFDIPCKQCGYPLSINLPTREEVSNSTRNRLGYLFQCRNCGNPNFFYPEEIMIQLGWMLLPRDLIIRIDFENIGRT